MTFLRLVANQVALAIDDALNYGALQQALAAASERAQSLEASDELLRALSPVLDVRDVFPRISEIAATSASSRFADPDVFRRNGRGRAGGVARL